MKTAKEVIAQALAGADMAELGFIREDYADFAEAALAALREAGYAVVPTAHLLQLMDGYGDDCPMSPAGFYEWMTEARAAAEGS